MVPAIIGPRKWPPVGGRAGNGPRMLLMLPSRASPVLEPGVLKKPTAKRLRASSPVDSDRQTASEPALSRSESASTL